MEILVVYFLLAILCSFIVLYIISPEPKIIVKYPKVTDNVSGLYVDDNDVCYRYHREEIKCSATTI